MEYIPKFAVNTVRHDAMCYVRVVMNDGSMKRNYIYRINHL